MKGSTWAVVLVALLVGPVQAQDSARERARRALSATGGATGRTAQRLTGFAGGIVLSELARAALAQDGDAARDAVEAPTSPEFLIGLLTFDRSLALSNTLLGRLPGLSGKVGSAIKHNLALAAAMTVAGAVEVDLGGASYADLVRLDPRALEQAQVKLHAVEGDRLGLTVATFAATVPLWTRIKGVAQAFGRAVAQRFAASAALKAGLALAPVPGGRVAAAGVVVWDVGAAAVDLAGLLTLAHTIEAPVQDLYADAKASVLRSVERRAVDAALAAGEVEEGAAAFTRWRQRNAEERNLAYQGVAKTDFALIRRLKKRGVAHETLNDVAEEAYGDFGGELALLAQTLILRETFSAGPHAALTKRATARQDRALRASAASRARSYERQLAQLERWRNQTTDDALGALLTQAAEELAAERTAEALLLQALGVPAATPPVAAPPARPSPGPDRNGLAGSLAH